MKKKGVLLVKKAGVSGDWSRGRQSQVSFTDDFLSLLGKNSNSVAGHQKPFMSGSWPVPLASSLSTIHICLFPAIPKHFKDTFCSLKSQCLWP